MSRRTTFVVAAAVTVGLSACGSSESAGVPTFSPTSSPEPSSASSVPDDGAGQTVPTATSEPAATSEPSDALSGDIQLEEVLDIAFDRNRSARNSAEINALQQSMLRAVDDSVLPGLLSTADLLRAMRIDDSFSGQTFRAFGSLVFEGDTTSLCIARREELELSCEFLAPVQLAGQALAVAQAEAGEVPPGVLETPIVALEGHLDPSEPGAAVVVTAYDQGSGLAGPRDGAADARADGADCEGERIADALNVLLGDDGRMSTTAEAEGETVTLFVVFPMTVDELESAASVLGCTVRMVAVLGLT